MLNVVQAFVPFIVLMVVPLVGAVVVLAMLGQRAKRFGYASTGAYLRAAPGSDVEKRDAADLALKGLVCCILGLFFAPFILPGLVPLFYGGRKIAYASMGLTLVEDPDHPAV